MLKNTCYEGQICKYDTPLEASAQGLLIEAYQHTQTIPNHCLISTFLTSKNIFSEVWLCGTILVIYVINNLFTGSLYTHIKGAHEGLKYYCNDCDYKATHCT